MIKIVVQKNMDGAYYALAYDGEDILFKTNLFDTAEGYEFVNAQLAAVCSLRP